DASPAAPPRSSRSARRPVGSRGLPVHSSRKCPRSLSNPPDEALAYCRAVDALARIAAEPGEAALFLDVDGVLAPIVERPEDARVPDETRDVLRRLAARYALVAAVTGRPSDVAREIVGVKELRYAGEHGLELAPAARDWIGRVHGFAAETAWRD